MAGIAALVESRPRDQGGLGVRRVLPSFPHRMVGPFICFDHMGPVRYEAGRGFDARPHPHIGLASLTYLYAGELLHRDSLGGAQTIRAGDVNWMTAGRGIVHSERTPPAVRAAVHELHGIQAWLALPRAYEDVEPSLHHHPGATLPLVRRDGAVLRVLAGRAFEVWSPVRAYGDLLFATIELRPGASIALPAEHAERALYLVDGLAQLEDAALHPGSLALLEPGETVTLRALEPCRALLLGGARVDGERHLWWNFVASTRERIDRAKADWSANRSGEVPGDDDRVPLPE